MRTDESAPNGAPAWEAVLFDYGNTLMEFDSPQLEFVLQGLVETYGEMLGPVAPEVLRQAIHEVINTPLPEQREIDPREEVAVLLERGWGERVTVTPELLERCNVVLQDYFVRAVEQLELVFQYRSAHLYGRRVFLKQIHTLLDESGRLTDPTLVARLEKMVKGFATFCREVGAST